jgi:hypothetical protein
MINWRRYVVKFFSSPFSAAIFLLMAQTIALGQNFQDEKMPVPALKKR